MILIEINSGVPCGGCIFDLTIDLEYQNFLRIVIRYQPKVSNFVRCDLSDAQVPERVLLI